MIIPAFLSAESLRYDLNCGGYTLVGSMTQGYTIKMADTGFGQLRSPGDPALPEKIIELRVPQEGVVSNIKLTVDDADVVLLPKVYNIAPQGPVLLEGLASWGEGKSIVNGKNTYVYDVNAFFPGETIELLPTVTKKELAGMDGRRRIYRLVRYLRLAFHPFAYNPVARQLKLAKSASVTVSYTVAALDKIPPAVVPAAPADYVIITTNAIVSGSTMLQSFVNMKEATGHTVRIVTEDDFGSLTGQAPNGRAEKIRQWLMDNYLALGIDYVLLIGDPDPDDPLNETADDKIGDVPMKMCYPGYAAPEDRNCPTDFFYADLAGNWDLDGDGLYGECVSADQPKSPSPAVGPDVFSARWTGKIQFDYSESYSLRLFADDGVRLYIDGDPVPLIDEWADHDSPLLYSGSVVGTTAGLHDITVEYYKNNGDAMIKLYWFNVNHDKGQRIVPADHLYHYDLATGTYVPGGLTAMYYNAIDLSGPPVMIDVGIINKVWLSGDYGTGGMQPQAQVSVGRIPVYQNDYYTLDDVLTKIIAYETDPSDISWRESVLLPMKPLDTVVQGYTLGEIIKTSVADPYGYKSFRIYEKDYAPSGPTPDLWPCTSDNVVAEWQNHYGMVTWWTHGGPDEAKDVLYLWDIENLDDAFPAITFQTSCTNGKPERHDNISYALLRHGGIATVSGTRVTYYSGDPIGDISDDANQNMAYYFTSYVMAVSVGPLSVGDALNLVYRNMKKVSVNMMAFVIYGDPDCRLLNTFPRQRPVAEAGGPYACTEGESLVLDAAGSSDPAGGSIEYRWDTDGDGIFDTEWSSDRRHTIDLCDKTVVVTVQVRNEIGCVSRDSATVTVGNLPPAADVGPDQTVYVNVTTRFTGSTTDPGNDVKKYLWDFGDGSSTCNWTLTPTHTYTAEGTYTVTLTVWDDFDAVGSDTLQVTVSGICPLSNENPARPWTKITGNYTLQPDTGLKTEGNISLKLNGTGYMAAATTVFSANEIRTYSDRLNLDIYMPSPASNPYWLGHVLLFINCPSAGVFNQYIGLVELTGLSLDSWQTLNFMLPSHIIDLFAGSSSDIRISVVVNTSQSSASPYRIDYLRFGGEVMVKPPVPSANRLENVWSAATAAPTYITLNSASEDAPVYCQTLHADWASQQWIMEPVPGLTDRVRLKCLWNDGSTDYYLTATGTSGSGEGDPVVGKALRTDWSSQMWIVEPGRGGSTRFKSAWSLSTYLTVKSTDDFSAVVCQPDHPDWSSQEWNVK